jgi:hypothetical protein
VRGIGELLRRRVCTLSKGRVKTLRDLGALKTEFGQIGMLLPHVSTGERKFRISEVTPLLRTNPGLDDELLRKIDEFASKDRRGEVTYNVTIFSHGSDLVVKDGNKRTIAFYERRRDSLTEQIDFPVFLIQPALYGS